MLFRGNIKQHSMFDNVHAVLQMLYGEDLDNELTWQD